MDEPLRHRQTKGAETDMLGLTSPRHIPTLPIPALQSAARSLLAAQNNSPAPLTFAAARPNIAAQAATARLFQNLAGGK